MLEMNASFLINNAIIKLIPISVRFLSGSDAEFHNLSVNKTCCLSTVYWNFGR
jgi:hypothetical protein